VPALRRVVIKNGDGKKKIRARTLFRSQTPAFSKIETEDGRGLIRPEAKRSSRAE
jgi:hypothetical protein